VSACLLGVECNHRGGASPSPEVAALAERGFRLIAVCPEVAGGLPTPRPAAEISPDGRVLTAAGEDVSDLYRRGAEHALSLARATSAVGAVLKARSPSCGTGAVYDGTFRRVLVAGDGITAGVLRRAGVPVCSEEQVADLPWPVPGA
jgi:uncharacterized protein YbbK (DUF523 family)